MNHEIIIPLSAEQSAYLGACDAEFQRARGLRDAAIRAIALGHCPSKDFETCRVQVTATAIICSVPKAAP